MRYTNLRTALLASAFLTTLAGSSPAQTTPDTTKGGPLDLGKMWTFDNPPKDYFQKTYKFTPDESGSMKPGWPRSGLRIIARLRLSRQTAS